MESNHPIPYRGAVLYSTAYYILYTVLLPFCSITSGVLARYLILVTVLVVQVPGLVYNGIPHIPCTKPTGTGTCKIQSITKEIVPIAFAICADEENKGDWKYFFSRLFG